MQKVSKNKQKPELLAPAGTVEVFLTALEQGADAIYVGTPKFNARLRAPNFSMDELARLIAFAHGIDRKVYITLNTLIKEAELPELIKTLDALRRLGPDALIVQDLAVFNLAKRVAPEIPLHASTQMTIHNLDGALQAKRMGFGRIILAREMTLDEIKAVRRKCKIELETFVHGAMCYSISGQCNFSSYVHGKSANRGQCLQPCRRLFDVDEQRLPIFATLDLGTAPILFQLISAGINCFKIEGRLKPAETIGQIVAAYRLLIDSYPTITKDIVAEARERLKLAIGRKQSTGFYLSPSPKDSMVGEGMSRSGRYLGKAVSAKGKSFEIRTREIIKVGDRLSVQKSRKKPPQGFNVKNLLAGKKPVRRSRANRPITVVAPFEVETGSAVVKLIDADAVTDEARRHEDKKWPKARARSKAFFAAELRMDWNSAVILETEVNGEKICMETWPSYEAYISQEEVMNLLNRSSGKFNVRLEVTSCSEFDDLVPMTEKEIEDLRTKTLAALVKKLDNARDETLKTLHQPLSSRTKQSQDKKDHIYVRIQSLRQAPALLKRPTTTVIAPLNEASHDSFADIIKEPIARESLFLELPTFAFEYGQQRDELIATLKHAIKVGIRQFFVSNIAHFNMLNQLRISGLKIIAADPLHCMNSVCVEQLYEMGASKIVFAQEGDRHTLEALAKRTGKEDLIIQVFGKVPLFRSRHPKPRSGLHARSVVGSREELQVLKRNRLTYVVSQRDFSLRHIVPDLKNAGFNNFLYDLTYTKSSVKLLKSLLQQTRKIDPRTENPMNF